MKYARINHKTNELCIFNTETLECIEPKNDYFGKDFADVKSADSGILAEYMESDLIVLSTEKTTLDILSNNTKYTLEFKDRLKINSNSIKTDLDHIFLYYVYKDGNIVYIEFKCSFFAGMVSFTLEFDSSTNRFTLQESNIEYSTVLTNIRGIPCSLDAYRKVYRRTKLLASE